MSLITELIERLRKEADGYMGYRSKRAVRVKHLLRESADTIETLSAKVQASNMERSTAYYNGGWIPVSERLPDDRDWYLGIFRESDTGWINPLPFVCDYVGYETKATTKEHWILRGFTDRDEHIDYYFNLECVAWIPLPTPYEPQKSEVQE